MSVTGASTDVRPIWLCADDYGISASVNKAIREFALASTTAATKLRLTVQNTIDRKSGVLDEKPPEMVAQRSSLLSGRLLDA